MRFEAVCDLLQFFCGDLALDYSFQTICMVSFGFHFSLRHATDFGSLHFCSLEEEPVTANVTLLVCFIF